MLVEQRIGDHTAGEHGQAPGNVLRCDLRIQHFRAQFGDVGVCVFRTRFQPRKIRGAVQHGLVLRGANYQTHLFCQQGLARTVHHPFAIELVVGIQHHTVGKLGQHGFAAGMNACNRHATQAACLGCQYWVVQLQRIGLQGHRRVNCASG